MIFKGLIMSRLSRPVCHTIDWPGFCKLLALIQKVKWLLIICTYMIYINRKTQEISYGNKIGSRNEHHLKELEGFPRPVCHALMLPLYSSEIHWFHFLFLKLEI